MPKNYLTYQSGSDTIRQMPSNYIIAKMDMEGRWVCDPDMACNHHLATVVFQVLLNYDAKYGSGGYLMEYITLALNTKKSVAISERSVEAIFARGCDCPTITNEVSRTLDEIIEKPTLQCPLCKELYVLVSTLLHVNEKNLLDLLNKY